MTLREALVGKKSRTIGTIQFRGDTYRLRLRYRAHSDSVEFRFMLMPGKDIPICVRFKANKDFWDCFQYLLKHNLVPDAEINITATDVPRYVSA